MLVCPIRAVANRAAKPADQKFFKADQLQVQVRTTFHPGEMILRIVVGVMVAWHIKERNIQHGQQVFEVWIGQVSTAEDQLDLAKVTAGTKAV